MEVQHTPAAVVAASGGMVLQQHIEDNQELCTRADVLSCVHHHVFLTYSVCKACKDQHFYSTLCGRGEGVSKKNTLCMLAKRLKIVDHPLHYK